MGYLNHRTRRAHIPFLTPFSKGACVLSCFSQVWLFATPWVDCSPPDSSVYGILQARILEWIAVPSSRGSSQPRDQTHLLHLLHWQACSSPLAPPGKPILWEKASKIVTIWWLRGENNPGSEFLSWFLGTWLNISSSLGLSIRKRSRWGSC